MAKPNHAKRARPRTQATKVRRLTQLRAADRQSRRTLERWRRG